MWSKTIDAVPVQILLTLHSVISVSQTDTFVIDMLDHNGGLFGQAKLWVSHIPLLTEPQILIFAPYSCSTLTKRIDALDEIGIAYQLKIAKGIKSSSRLHTSKQNHDTNSNRTGSQQSFQCCASTPKWLPCQVHKLVNITALILVSNRKTNPPGQQDQHGRDNKTA